MIREEEIVEAAFSYSKETSNDKFCSDAFFIGFIEGSLWSDKHYKNFWHDSEEVPEEKLPILIYRDSKKSRCYTGKSNAYILEDWNDWNSAVKIYGIISWAYIKNLLP